MHKHLTLGLWDSSIVCVTSLLVLDLYDGGDGKTLQQGCKTLTACQTDCITAWAETVP